MSDKYEIRHWQDNEYAVYPKDDWQAKYVFRGTLPEVNAWMSLQEKGFTI